MKRGGLIFLVIIVFIISIVLIVKNNNADITGNVVLYDSSKPKFTIVIPLNINDEINKLYQKGDKEFILCLQGKKENNFYFITGYSFPNYVKESYSHAVYNSCEEDDIGTLHNHYNPQDEEYLCQLSVHDIYSFGQDGKEITGIICGLDKYSFIEKSELSPMNVKII